MQLPFPVVFDHFGQPKAPQGVGQPGFANLLDLVKSGHAYVKISGAYRAPRRRRTYADATPLAKALVAAQSRPHTSGALTGRSPKRRKRPLDCRDRAAVPDRRRALAQRVGEMGARCGDAQEKSWSTIRRGSTDSTPRRA